MFVQNYKNSSFTSKDNRIFLTLFFFVTYPFFLALPFAVNEKMHWIPTEFFLLMRDTDTFIRLLSDGVCNYHLYYEFRLIKHRFIFILSLGQKKGLSLLSTTTCWAFSHGLALYQASLTKVTMYEQLGAKTNSKISNYITCIWK